MDNTTSGGACQIVPKDSLRSAAQKITKRGERIEEIEVGDGAPEAGPAEELETPKPRIISASGE